MRTTLDFTPFYRSSIGFDRLFDLLQDASRLGPAEGWPPYNIERAGEDSYRIAIAVPGFARDDLQISQQPNLLVVSGSRPAEDKAEYLHRGIDNRGFSRSFELADYVDVSAANLENGLLTIELRRELPEAMKPRRIDIRPAGEAAQPQKQIEGGRHAA